MDWIDQLEETNKSFKEVFTFDEYMETFERNPRRELRTTSIYLKDMFNHYGKHESGAFNLFRKAHPDAPPVCGQASVQEGIYHNLLNFTDEGFNNKFLLLVGPNGSAKSSLIKKIMKAAEEYSDTDSGPLYSFSWIFPIDSYIKGNLGFAGTATERNLASFAHLDDKDISAILGSELNDHPILLLPIAMRRKMINELLADHSDQLETIKKSYLYNGDISKRNRLIFDALLKNYKGDYKEVLKHIRIERIHINRRYSNMAVTVEPQLHVDAHSQQITMDKRLASLPPSLQSLNLFTMTGEVVHANRGILEFSDLLKRPLDAFKYLLMTMETKTVNLKGILTELDIFFIGTSNEIHLAAFKQHPDYNSFKGRFNFLKVPYLLNAKYEKEIYREQVDNLKNLAVFEPHAIEALATWCVMTRIRQPQAKNFKNQRLGKIAASLNPLEKVMFISDDSIPDKFDTESKKLLRQHKGHIIKEFENDALYEGKFGISPREVKQIIYELSSEYNIITFVQVLEYLRKFIRKKNEHDFLNIAVQGEYHNPVKFIEFIEAHSLEQFDNEVREGLGIVDARSYEDYISKYIMHVSCLIKGEKIKNSITGKFEPADMYFIKEFEGNLNLKEDPEKFRSQLISTLGAWYLDNPNTAIIYTEVFSDLNQSLQQSFRKEQKKLIDKISKNLVIFLDELDDGQKREKSLNEDNRNLIKNVISHLQEAGYSRDGAINCLKYLLKKMY